MDEKITATIEQLEQELLEKIKVREGLMDQMRIVERQLLRLAGGIQALERLRQTEEKPNG